MKPSLGRIVIAETDQSFNGSVQHPALITRVWNVDDPDKGGTACVNLKVFPDCGAPFDITSVMLFQSLRDAVAAGYTGQGCCWWPERV